MIDLTVGALATWRLSHLFLYESGPFSLFKKIRERLGVEYSLDGELISYKYEITTCIWCLSIWTGGVIAVMYWLAGGVSRLILLPFAFSAVSCILGKRDG